MRPRPVGSRCTSRQLYVVLQMLCLRKRLGFMHEGSGLLGCERGTLPGWRNFMLLRQGLFNSWPCFIALTVVKNCKFQEQLKFL